jgi:hypothetical protein
LTADRQLDEDVEELAAAGAGLVDAVDDEDAEPDEARLPSLVLLALAVSDEVVPFVSDFLASPLGEA